MTALDARAIDGLLAAAPLVVATGIKKVFRRQGLAAGTFTAVDDVDLRIAPGETLGLVGESGSGKSTVGRMLVGMYRPDAGRVVFAGDDVSTLRGAALRRLHQSAAMVFQDPYSALDPRWTIERIIAEPLAIAGESRRNRRRQAAEALRLVGLDESHLLRRPADFSGGQRQRIAVARALVSRPRLIVCDESVSALDVSTQAQVLGLLRDLQERLGVAYLFISHDLNAVRRISDRVAVMYLGRLVEEGPTEQVVTAPAHPYAAALVSAMPVPDPLAVRGQARIVLAGSPPSAADPPSGCSFRTRCPLAMPICTERRPAWTELSGGRRVACHLYDRPNAPRAGQIGELMLAALSIEQTAQQPTAVKETR
jgi:oligopeptide/dipeptide ABC transporter ATP-binding protein